MELSTYLFFNGQCKEAFQFYEKALRGKIGLVMTYGESPEKDKCGPESRDKIMHVRLKGGDHHLMASDAPPDHYHKPQGVSVSDPGDTNAEAERGFKAHAENW